MFDAIIVVIVSEHIIPCTKFKVLAKLDPIVVCSIDQEIGWNFMAG